MGKPYNASARVKPVAGKSKYGHNGAVAATKCGASPQFHCTNIWPEDRKSRKSPEIGLEKAFNPFYFQTCRGLQVLKATVFYVNMPGNAGAKIDFPRHTLDRPSDTHEEARGLGQRKGTSPLQEERESARGAAYQAS